MESDQLLLECELLGRRIFNGQLINDDYLSLSFLFVMNNIGGNLPILVDPLAKAIGYRESVSIFYAGFYLISEF